VGQKVRVIKAISIDSRTIQPDELFIPLSGPRHDGRKFIPSVLAKGALALETKAGLTALHILAAAHRQKFDLPVIGVTGSVGKTSTKDMLAAILCRLGPTLKNEENFNNEIGVPLTLLKLSKKHKYAVIEMAMQGLGEIALLADIVRPTIAIVTNIGEAHLEKLGSVKNIAKAKSEIFTYLGRSHAAVINLDDDYYEHLLAKVRRTRCQVKTFGILKKADITPQQLTGITLPVPGEHMIYNALAATAAATILKAPKRAIKQGLESLQLSSQRMHAVNLPNCIKIVDDTYNANPQSMAAALKALEEIGPVCHLHRQVIPRRIAVLGDMLELGRQSKALHKRIAALAKQLKLNRLFTFGRHWPRSTKPFGQKQTLITELKKYLRPHDIILVKGSRGMRMEEIIDSLR